MHRLSWWLTEGSLPRTRFSCCTNVTGAPVGLRLTSTRGPRRTTRQTRWSEAVGKEMAGTSGFVSTGNMEWHELGLDVGPRGCRC